MKKIIIPTLMILLIPTVFAWFPEAYIDGLYEGYSELCIERVPYEHWWEWFFRPSKKYTCTQGELDQIRQCNQDNPKDYDCQNDVQRGCSRDCWDYNLEYSHIGGGLFSLECWCIKDELPKRIW